MTVPETLIFSRFSRAWRKRLEVSRQRAADMLDIPLKTLEGWELGREPEHKRVVVLAMRQLEDMHSYGPQPLWSDRRHTTNSRV